jgi:hypothetical protein
MDSRTMQLQMATGFVGEGGADSPRPVMRIVGAITTGCATLIFAVLLGGGLIGQEPVPPRAPQVGSRDNPPRDLRIEIEVPAQRLEAGRDLGFVALLTNTSESEVRFSGGESLTLTIPLSLDPLERQFGWHAFFPTQPDGKEFVLQPGDAYRVFWSTKDFEAAPPPWFTRLVRALADLMNPRVLFFEPGDYSVAVNAQYRTAAADGPFRTVTATASLPVAAPMLVVLFGAAIGGVISFVLMPTLKLRKSWEWRNWDWPSVLTSTSGALGTALLSVIVTILLSRISSTEFFFKVTVNDVWGAVAVGFFAPLSASGLIGRITATPTASGQRTAAQTPLATLPTRPDHVPVP